MINNSVRAFVLYALLAKSGRNQKLGDCTAMTAVSEPDDWGEFVIKEQTQLHEDNSVT